MKKVIITRDNYEEIMFGLLENEYSKDVRENIFEQIHSDTFLTFEWKQWSKTQYTESTETYKEKEAEFLESLTREPSDRKGFVFFYKPLALAASLLLLLGLSILVFRQSETPDSQLPLVEDNLPEVKATISSNPEGNKQTEEVVASAEKTQRITRVLPLIKQDTFPALKVTKNDMPLAGLVDDIPVPKAIEIARTQVAPRFKVSITEEAFSELDNNDLAFQEKRYTMADVMNKKDGISLSKFLDNARTHIVEDKEKHITYIEYIAADMSVLVVPLTN
jgi:hypothetical protein